jgi:enolase
MKIKTIYAYEIFDARGLPALECCVILDDDTKHVASVPTGISKGSFESYELRDGGERLGGLGVHTAIAHINKELGPLFIGAEPDGIQTDLVLLERDGTQNKQRYGANTLLALSMALYRAHAAAEKVELYELIGQLCGFDSVSLPVPIFDVISGGVHAESGLSVQELMLVPFGAKTVRHALEIEASAQQLLKTALQNQGKRVIYGDTGGIITPFRDEKEALDLLMMIIQLIEAQEGEGLMIALDVAASQLYDRTHNVYVWRGEKIMTDTLLSWYDSLVSTYPIYALIDGMSEHDLAGWQALYEQFSDSTLLFGDDLCATHADRIAQAVERNIIDGVIIKPNQIGTVTETLQAVKLCYEHNKRVIVSHRAGETNDTFIVDLAVGVSASGLKAGALNRGERVTKYNRLIEIESLLLKEL